MVYLGPSRGCNSCRVRRKKCDETRPSCQRCIRANRTCGGYEAHPSSTFRQYAADAQPAPLKSIARKCTLPRRQPTPGSDSLPADTIPPEVTLAKSNELALRAFIYDYCLDSNNLNLSRGYLVDLERTVRRLGLKSDLTRACQAISCASDGKSKHRPQLVDRAEMFYQELLGSMAKILQNPEAADSRESKTIAMLLGLYQIVMPVERAYSPYDAHSKGLAALMNIAHSPFSIISPPRESNVKANQYSGVFNVPALNNGGLRLDTLLLALNGLWTRVETKSEGTNLLALRDEIANLDQLLQQWQASRTSEFQPTPAGQIDISDISVAASAAFWPGRVDTYFDLYVAGVWNVLRSARLLLCTLSLQLSEILGPDDTSAKQLVAAHSAAQDMLASIPYHLVENLQVFLNDVHTNPEMADPGRKLGGLLLLHPLYVLSRMSFVSQEMRECADTCLRWIGSEMGFGQATLLAENSNMDRDYLASKWMIIWSGFFL